MPDRSKVLGSRALGWLSGGLILLLPLVLVQWAAFHHASLAVERSLQELANASALRTDHLLTDTRDRLRQLASATSARCSDAAVTRMQELVYGSPYVRELGIVEQDEIVCTNFGLLQPTLSITDPALVRVGAPGEMVIIPPARTRVMNNVSIVINMAVRPGAYVDALIDPKVLWEFSEFFDFADRSGVVLLLEDGEPLASIGSISGVALPPLRADQQFERGRDRVAEVLSDRCIADPDFHVSINTTAVHFQTQWIVEAAQRAMGSRLPLSQVVFEITERDLLQGDDLAARHAMERLRELGASLSVDDFGTGYASLRYLQSFPVDWLKIDKTFVDGIGRDMRSTGLIDHIIAIGRSLGLGVIAEGVETIAQAEHLRSRGVRYARGWLYAKAMPIEQLRSFLA